ncbi:MAG: cardiolipin synthase [Deltaproteobacteria bacterium]|nr:cardiolipin synthase [Deltaproteobacteria bacterium]
MSIPSVLVMRRGRPMAAMSWILCLLTLPVLGMLLWWVLGRRHLERKRRRKRQTHATICQSIEELRHNLEASRASRANSIFPLAHVPAAMADSVFEPTGGNDVTVLDSKEAFDKMAEDIRGARHHVHAMFYIWKADETGRQFRDLLAEKAREGVQVRVLCDAVGSPAMRGPFARPLRQAGASVVRFMPPRLLSRSPRLNFRNHRKILVVDGEVGVISGFNIGDEYRKRWRDVGLRIAGPAVDQLQEIFADDWYYATDENLADPAYFCHWKTDLGPRKGADCAAVASGPDSEFMPIHDAMFVAINRTKRRLYVTTPYFIPSRPIVAALRAATYRGVDVRLMLPALSDMRLVRWAARSYYEELLAVGVRIFEYQPSMLHAKVMVFDDDLAVLGSANLDSRSFRLNFEASCFVHSEQIASDLIERFETNLKDCAEVLPAEFERRPWAEKLLDGTANLLSPLL